MKKLQDNPLIASILIGILAAVFRLSYLNLIEFKFDEAYNLLQIINFYHGRLLIADSGIASIGFHSFPFPTYFLALLSVFSRNPQAVSFVIALLNTLAVVAFYLIVKKFFRPITALVAASIAATSPWMIILSRKIWAPDLIFIFMLPLLYSFLSLRLKKSNLQSFILALSIVLLIQVHLSGLFIAPLLLLVFKKLNWKYAIIGFLVGLIPIIPYFFQDNYYANVLTNFQAVPGFADANVFVRPFEMSNGLGFDDSLGPDYPTFLSAISWTTIVYIINGIVLLFGIIIALRNKARRDVALPIVVVPFLFLITQTVGRPYYFLILSPFLFIAEGFALEALIKQKLLFILVSSFFVLLIASNLYFEWSFDQFLSTGQAVNGDYGQLYFKTKPIIDKATEQYKGRSDYDIIRGYAGLFAYVTDQPELMRDAINQYLNQTP